MSLATRVAELATRIGTALRITRYDFTPNSAVETSTLKIRKQLGVITLEGSVVLTESLAGGNARQIGTIPTGARPVTQMGFGAYFYDPTGGPGAVLITGAGAVFVVQYSGSSRKSLALSASYEAA